MGNFSFGMLANTDGVSKTSMYLKPWGIYHVAFDGIEKVSFQGKEDPTKVYHAIDVKFKGDEGAYTERIFYPNDDSNNRPEYEGRNGKYYGPSSFERTMSFIAQLSQVLNPEGYKKMQAVSAKFKSFEDVVNAFIKITESNIGQETNLKLVGRVDKNGVVRAALPKFVAVNKEGDLFISDNFVGEKLFFTEYEESRRKEYLSATPSTVASPISKAIEDMPTADTANTTNLDDLLPF